MEPIINPIWIYLLGIVENVNIFVRNMRRYDIRTIIQKVIDWILFPR